MASRTPNSELRTPKLDRLVPALLQWFAANARDLPWRRTRDPYAIWVSEIMLQQTQVKTVIPYWERWLRALPTIAAVARAGPDKIHKLWEGLGYYARARNLQKAARQIVAKHGGEFPDQFDAVLALPGIGRYTAGAICSIAFNQATPILDGNVIRVLTRIFGIADNPGEKETNARLWKLAEELVATAANHQTRQSRRREEAHSEIGDKQSLLTPAATMTGNCSALNQSLMELGALVCTPRHPRCGICPAKKVCVAFREQRIAELPDLGKRAAATARRFVAFVVERKGRFLVRQRPAGVVNALLWEFPNVEIDPRRSGSPAKRDPSGPDSGRNGQSRWTPAATAQKLSPDMALAAEQLGFEPDEVLPLCTVKHSITRYRITLEAFVIRLKKFPARQRGWRRTGQIQQLAFAGAHRKILDLLIQRQAQNSGCIGRDLDL